MLLLHAKIKLHFIFVTLAMFVYTILKFRGCQFAVHRIDNLLFAHVNVEILWLLQTNARIFNYFFSRITSDFGAVGGIVGANQCNVTIETIIFEACRA